MWLINPLRIFRNWTALLGNSFIRYIVLLPLRFHCKRSVVGKCMVLAPEKQLQVILGGLEYLRAIDQEMFQQLTCEHSYLFWYHPTQYLRCRDSFTITDQFLQWGKQGICIAFVQSSFNYKIGYLKWEKTLFHGRKMRCIIRREIYQKVFEWISRHSFSPELVKHYRELAESD